MCEHKHFLKEAIRISGEQMRSGNGGPFGAVVVKDGKVVGVGQNEVTSSNDPTAHAEMVAIRNACKELGDFKLEGCTIYSSCEPCPMCLAGIYWARIDKIYFANSREDAASIDFDDEFLYQEIGKPLDDRKVPTLQLMRDEAFKVFEEWKEKEDKIKY